MLISKLEFTEEASVSIVKISEEQYFTKNWAQMFRDKLATHPHYDPKKHLIIITYGDHIADIRTLDAEEMADCGWFREIQDGAAYVKHELMQPKMTTLTEAVLINVVIHAFYTPLLLALKDPTLHLILSQLVVGLLGTILTYLIRRRFENA